MSVALSIVFTGLCALVTDGDRAPAEVLLVDAEGVGEVAGFAMPRHAPSLVVGLGDLANAQDSMPTRVVTAWPGYGSDLDASESAATTASQLGIWDLTGSTVRIRVQGREGTGVELYRPGDSRSSWPDPPHDRNDANAWRDLRFMANMETLSGDGRIDHRLERSRAGPVATRRGQPHSDRWH